MVRVIVPGRITELSILSLARSETPLLSIKEIRDFDFLGMESFNAKIYKKSLYEKLIAAKSYERRREHFKDPFDSAMAYDRASASAYLVGFKTVDLICAIRSARLHYENLEFLKDPKNLELFIDPEDTVRRTREGLNFTKEFIQKNKYKPIIHLIRPHDHIWFSQSKKEAAA